MPINSNELRRQLLLLAFDDGEQGVKLVMRCDRLDESSGWPGGLLQHYRKKNGGRLPIDLHPDWPINLTHDDDALHVDLSLGSFGVRRCTIPWEAIEVFAIGVDHVPWKHEGAPPALRESAPRAMPALRLVRDDDAS